MRNDKHSTISLFTLFTVFTVFALFTIMLLPANVSAASISSRSLTLEKGQTASLRISGGKGKVTWKSSKPSVAAVSKNGTVTAKKAGSAKITAKQGKKSYTCRVQVANTQSGSGDIVLDAARNVTSAGMTAEETQVFQKMMSLKGRYPEGTTWTNDQYYAWSGGIYAGGYGCAAFAFLLSDTAFGSRPARMHTDISAIRVGDILRVDGNSHSVIVLKVTSDSVIVAEGNYGKRVHWGREIAMNTLRQTLDNVITRY